LGRLFIKIKCIYTHHVHYRWSLFYMIKNYSRTREEVNQKMASLVEAGIGLMIAVVVVAGVAIPVVQDVINNTTFNNSTVETIMPFITVGLAVSLLIAAFSMAR